MNEMEIAATFRVSIPTINHHIALAESNIGARRSALEYVHFEIENDHMHIVTTNGRVLLHTEVRLDDKLAKGLIAFDIRGMPRITARTADTRINKKTITHFLVNDGLISTGLVVARLAVDVGFLEWRKIFPGRACLERETAWRAIDPKYYALAQKFAGGDAYANAYRFKGSERGPVAFFKIDADENELNTTVVMPPREP